MGKEHLEKSQNKAYKKLSIIIPIYNEEATIEALLKKVISVKIPLKKEILCVDDGSTDRSAEIVKRVITRHKGQDLTYIHKENGGKGSAVRLGLQRATGDIFIIQDADLEYDPEDYNKVLVPILEEGAQVVYGSRYMSQQGHLKENNHLTYKIHLLGNNVLSLVTSMLYGHKITDMETCYKMFTRDVYESFTLTSDDFSIEPEITSKMLKSGYYIMEVPISYYSRDFSEGKKITWRDGVKALGSLLKWRFTK